MASNYSVTPIVFRGTRYSSIKEAMEETGISRYLIKKEAEYVNPADVEKFAGTGAKPQAPDQTPTREEIEGVYEGNIRESARALGITERVFLDLLAEYNIPRITRSEAQIRKSDATKPPKGELEEMYAESSVEELLRHYRINYRKLIRWLDSYSIPRRTHGETASVKHSIRRQNVHPGCEALADKYSRRSIHELSLEYGVDKYTVSGWLTECGIDISTNDSRAESELFEYCQSLDDSFIRGDRELIRPLELDIVSHRHKLAIEYCGLYWHSESVGRTKNYHRDKYLKCRALGYRLLTVFESDDPGKMRALIRTHLGVNEKVGARTTRVCEIEPSIAHEFHRAHHLSGTIGARVHIGLYNGDELVMVGSFGSAQHNSGYQWECARMTSHSEYTTVGGASKMFRYFFRNYEVESCITYADLRFGEGKVYEHCGFTRQDDSQPNYFYFKTNEMISWSRVKFQKHKLPGLLEHFDPELTEAGNMKANGYHRIWDCGNAVYTYPK